MKKNVIKNLKLMLALLLLILIPMNVLGLEANSCSKNPKIIINEVGESLFLFELLDNYSENKVYTIESSNNDIILAVGEQKRLLASGVGEANITIKSNDLVENFTIQVLNPSNISIDNFTTNNKSRNEITQAVLAKAKKMIDVKWTPTNDLKGWRQLSTFKANVQQTGIPYTQWSQKDEKSFITALNSNSDFYQGVTNNGVYMPRYGNDCSGFVSFSYGLTRHNTWELEDKIDSGYFDSVSITNLYPGDAVVTNKPDQEHTFIIASVSGSNITCYEQTPHKSSITTWTLSQLQAAGYRGFRIKDNGTLPQTLKENIENNITTLDGV